MHNIIYLIDGTWNAFLGICDVSMLLHNIRDRCICFIWFNWSGRKTNTICKYIPFFIRRIFYPSWFYGMELYYLILNGSRLELLTSMDLLSMEFAFCLILHCSLSTLLQVLRVLCLVHVLLFSTLCPSSFAIILMGFFYFNCLPDVLWLFCSVALPHGSLGWSAVCDCCNSWSYSLLNTIYK